jgi:hypothetical protein
MSQRPGIWLRRVLLGLSAGSLLSGGVPGAASAADSGMLRTASGTIQYRTVNEQAIRGTETWTLLVHPDGSRTLNTTILNRERASTSTIIHRVDPDFHPLDTFVERWVGNVFLGVGLFSVRGRKLTGLSRGTAGEASHEMIVPDNVTLISHAVAADGWQVLPQDMAVTKKAEMTAYSIQFKAEATIPFLGSVLVAPVEWIGHETIRVPAGQFDTTHIRVSDRFDIWLFGPDRTLARMVEADADREYLLIEYQGLR